MHIIFVTAKKFTFLPLPKVPEQETELVRDSELILLCPIRELATHAACNTWKTVARKKYLHWIDQSEKPET